MVESREHKDLKEYGRVILMKKGFRTDEIYEEYRLKIKKLDGVTPRRMFLIDICGISDREDFNKSVAIECGNTEPEKLVQVRLFFDEVIHLPYDIEFTLDDSYNVIEGYQKHIKTLETDIEKLTKQYSDLERENSLLVGYKSKSDRYKSIIDFIELIDKLEKGHIAFLTKKDVKTVLDNLKNTIKHFDKE